MFTNAVYKSMQQCNQVYIYPSVGTAIPYMYGILYCLVLFTNNPIRREFRCPLYCVFALRHNQHTHTLAAYKQNEEYSIVTWNMKHLSNVWCLITQFQHHYHWDFFSCFSAYCAHCTRSRSCLASCLDRAHCPPALLWLPQRSPALHDVQQSHPPFQWISSSASEQLQKWPPGDRWTHMSTTTTECISSLHPPSDKPSVEKSSCQTTKRLATGPDWWSVATGLQLWLPSVRISCGFGCLDS